VRIIIIGRTGVEITAVIGRVVAVRMAVIAAEKIDSEIGPGMRRRMAIIA
jgi:hypothetical protein